MTDKKIHIPQADSRQHDESLLELPQLQAENPFDLFSTWYEEARHSEPADPNAMSLATADKNNMPNVRMVLLKGFDENGFVFYTNTESQKGNELKENPKAALCFHWKSLLKQVRVQGIVEQVSDLDADEYYKSRDRKSRIGAWVSQQSRPLESRASLLADIAKYGLKYAIGDIPRPQYWSGYRVKPLYLEFWRNGAFRLHDRLVFSRQSINDNWIKNTLQP